MDYVKAYYDENSTLEWDRLDNPYSRIEFTTTTHLIDKYFKNISNVIDIGSGSGRYSIELIKRGFDVSLLDLSQNLLDIAKKNIENISNKKYDYFCKSALELDFIEGDAFEYALVLGPLYHLHNEEDRLKVINDTYRILKPGGRAIIAYINTWGVLKAAVYEFPDIFEDIGHFDRYLNGNIKFSKEESFTETFFTTAEHAIEEVSKSKLKIISTAGAESFLSGLIMDVKDLYKRDINLYNKFIKKAAEYSEEEQYRNITEHFLIVVEK
ncbi:class I SAM-dependent methyltransferase [Tissierella carlieri]|uniref:Class I SAM-dependent methyltransferase n=1 Tax=Tissierella carlieri TaxID=689904 RepID=A0ABT1SDG4_9FIRM|nr:class I SAM-dependent methyltransferase [Tissierella carlieri]MCQ4924519.1 class I SAM-dependent methyltransferase [Tissierella carlieri]